MQHFKAKPEDIKFYLQREITYVGVVTPNSGVQHPIIIIVFLNTDEMLEMTGNN